MKKKILSLCLLLALLTGILSPASAIIDGNYLPYDIQEWFDNGDYDNMEICGSVELNNYFFVLGQYGSQNTLFAFKYSKGSYRLWMKSIKAVPQGSNRIVLSNITGTTNEYTGKTFSKPTICIEYLNASGHTCDVSVVYSFTNGSWNLRRYVNMNNNVCIMASTSGLTYYKGNSGNRVGSASGTVQTDIRYVSLSVLPKSLSAAQDKLTEAPTIPQPSGLICENIQFTGGKKYEVYSGPGEYYVRSGNGKAKVSTNDWIQVFGEENGWILIQYAIDSNHMRFGYISSKALPKNAEVYSLGLSYVTYTLEEDATLTDDPLYSRASLKWLPAGTKVNYLCRMGNWAYVETTSGSLARGFVPLTSIDMSETAYGDADDYAEEEINEVNEDEEGVG